MTPIGVLLLLLTVLPVQGIAGSAPQAQAFQRLDNCRLLSNRYNDGDSFHVMAEGKEWIFRLYFVDAPETDSDYPERTAEQAAYFNLSPAQTLKLGRDAAAFTRAKLGGGFTVWTRWRKALGRSTLQRYYAFVVVNGEPLADTLVRNGLARVYGTRTPLPDGRDSRTYLGLLGALEEQAKARKIGGWKRDP